MNHESSAIHAVPSGSPAPSAQVISLGEFHSEPGRSPAAGAPVVQSFNPLHAVRTRLQASVGEVSITIGELMNAKEHQVLMLNRMIDDPVDLMLEGRVVARGQLVAVDGCFGIRITELPQPLSP